MFFVPHSQIFFPNVKTNGKIFCIQIQYWIKGGPKLKVIPKNHYYVKHSNL